MNDDDSYDDDNKYDVSVEDYSDDDDDRGMAWSGRREYWRGSSASAKVPGNVTPLLIIIIIVPSTIFIIVITVITLFTFLPSSPICKFVNWYNLKKNMKTNHSKHSGFFERQLKITISIRRQTHCDFQLRNISLGRLFHLTILEIFHDAS